MWFLHCVCFKDIQGKVQEITEAQHNANSLEREIKEQVYEINKHTKESTEAANKVKQLLEEHDWIQHEKNMFGKKDSLFDFEANNPKDLSKR